jgi:hypothetical protein
VTEAEQLRQQHAEAMAMVDIWHRRYLAWQGSKLAWECMVTAASRANAIEMQLLRMEAPNV